MTISLILAAAAVHPAQAAAQLAHAADPTGEHAGPTLLGLGAEGWVYVGLTIFILLAIFVAKAPQRIAAMLDERIADTRRTLDEAKALRSEAEALLARATESHASASAESAAIIATAQHESAALLAQAEVDAKALVALRQRTAEERIAAAERAAIADIRATATRAAVDATRTLIADGHGADQQSRLVDRAIADVGKL